jgi:glycosyltransferase involved in cell wall biosynthesis
MPKVCTIHDLGYLDYSAQFTAYDYWQLRLWTAISISISKYIIAVSKSTKKDIVRHYSSASKKVKVVHHGYDSVRFNSKISPNVVRRVRAKYGIDDEYVLFLGTLKPSKNIEGLLNAWSNIRTQAPAVNLVIAGKKGWLYKSIFKKVKSLHLERSVIFTDYVSEKDKPALIAGAKIFVTPSFWEGFGMDVLSAMACGVPVIVSRIASLPEVAGKAGVYINPNDPKSIAKGILGILSMSTKRYNRQIEKGFKQVRKFSWESTARKTLAVIEGVR